ncbi:DUF1707 SHOCT-like domain-containing protein [Microlunatus parietis]|uniref:DUF1707 domain-containing protein n=1 Tax=Microlunatus parietis TaxID=682979 RepID=A0A7Y9I9C9_9ACTN|nr:DUF1707 domain-containing protein [Microlunatus parietis]NYE72665.1 hypothetical protein [Microlunatus parietis]
MPEQLEPMIEAVREACIEQIQRQYALGRLTQDDLDDRVGLALQARTPSALAALTADLTPPAPADPPAPVPVPVPVKSEPGRRRRTVLAIAGAAAVLAAGVGVVGLATNTAASSQAVASVYCESTGRDDTAQPCPPRSAAQIRLDAYADQLQIARGDIEMYEPSRELLARVEKGIRLAEVAQARARAEALIEAAGGKPDTAALEKLALELEAAVRDSAEALAEAAAAQPR